MNENNSDDMTRLTGDQPMSAYDAFEPARPSETVWGAASPAAPAQENEAAWGAQSVRQDPSWYDSAAAADTQAQPEKKSRRRGMSTLGIVALCLACAIIASVASAGVTYMAVRKGGVAENILPTSVPVISTVSYDGASNDAAASVYELAKQQVVGINTTVTYNAGFFGQTGTAQVSGSGFVITEDGYIVTNYHVIEDAYKGGYPVNVIMYDETTYEAEIIGFDAGNDIALLKIDAQGLSAAQLGDSDTLVVGQTVYAIGNPLGYLSYTMTSGIVSALDRTISTDTTDAVKVFQIDAAVNSGNSGGPVYNDAGQVIGVVNAKSSVTNVEGLGFAIPISDVAHIVNQLLENGYVADRAHMGVSISTVTESAAQSYNMVVGAYVNKVTEGGAAEAAGIREGDIITAVDGEKVTSSGTLTAIVRTHYAGDTAQITVWRDGEELTLTIVFDESPEPTEEEPQEQSQEPSGEPGQPYTFSFDGDMEDFFRQFFGFGN